MEDLIQRAILNRDNKIKIIDMCVSEVPPHQGDCPCPYCNFNIQVSVFCWKQEQISLRHYCFYVCCIDSEVYKISEKQKMPLELFPNYHKHRCLPEIENALYLMATEKWSTKEQSDDAWDKNREMY
jgi:hypothetical protein